MRIRQITCLSIGLLLPQLAPAKVAMPAPSLGQIESILDFCAKVNPELASKISDAKKALAGDATDKEVAEVRGSQEYKDSYDASNEKLANVPREKAIKACSAQIEQKK
jgi:hypothetical protein